MGFTPAQQTQAAQQIQNAIDKLASARATILANPNSQFPTTVTIRAAVNDILDTLLLSGAALED